MNGVTSPKRDLPARPAPPNQASLQTRPSFSKSDISDPVPNSSASHADLQPLLPHGEVHRAHSVNLPQKPRVPTVTKSYSQREEKSINRPFTKNSTDPVRREFLPPVSGPINKQRDQQSVHPLPNHDEDQLALTNTAHGFNQTGTRNSLSTFGSTKYPWHKKLPMLHERIPEHDHEDSQSNVESTGSLSNDINAALLQRNIPPVRPPPDFNRPNRGSFRASSSERYPESNHSQIADRHLGSNYLPSNDRYRSQTSDSYPAPGHPPRPSPPRSEITENHFRTGVPPKPNAMHINCASNETPSSPSNELPSSQPITMYSQTTNPMPAFGKTPVQPPCVKSNDYPGAQKRTSPWRSNSERCQQLPSLKSFKPRPILSSFKPPPSSKSLIGRSASTAIASHSPATTAVKRSASALPGKPSLPIYQNVPRTLKRTASQRPNKPPPGPPLPKRTGSLTRDGSPPKYTSCEEDSDDNYYNTRAADSLYCNDVIGARCNMEEQNNEHHYQDMEVPDPYNTNNNELHCASLPCDEQSQRHGRNGDCFRGKLLRNKSDNAAIENSSSKDSRAVRTLQRASMVANSLSALSVLDRAKKLSHLFGGQTPSKNDFQINGPVSRRQAHIPDSRA